MNVSTTFNSVDTRRPSSTTTTPTLLPPRRDIDLFSQRFSIKQAKREHLLNWVEAQDEIARIPADFTQQMYHLGSALAASALWHSEHASNLLQQVTDTQHNCFNSRRSRRHQGIRARRGLPLPSSQQQSTGGKAGKEELFFLSSGDSSENSSVGSSTNGCSSASSSCASLEETKISNRSVFEGLSRKNFDRLKDQLEDLVLDRGYLNASAQIRCLPLWELHEEYTSGPKVPKIEL